MFFICIFCPTATNDRWNVSVDGEVSLQPVCHPCFVHLKGTHEHGIEHAGRRYVWAK